MTIFSQRRLTKQILKTVPAIAIVLFMLGLPTYGAPTSEALQEQDDLITKIKLIPDDLLSSGEFARLRAMIVPGPLDRSAIEETCRRLIATGKIATIETEVTTRKGERILLFHLTPQRYARSITFEGRSQIKKDRLTAAIDLKKYSIITEESLQTAVQQIKEFYVFLGFPEPTVTYSLGDSRSDGGTPIRFQLAERALPNLGAMTVEVTGHPGVFARWRLLTSFKLFRLQAGRNGYCEERLKRKLAQAERRLRLVGYQDATFALNKASNQPQGPEAIEVVLDVGKRVAIKTDDVGIGVKRKILKPWRKRNIPLTDLEIDRLAKRMADALKKKGFLDVTVASTLTESESRRILLFDAEKRSKYHVAQINIDGNKAFDDSELLEALTIRTPRFWGMLTSKPASENLKSSHEGLEGFYAAHGYPLAKTQSSLDEGLDSGRTVTFEITEGPYRKFGEIIYEGITFLSPPELHSITGLNPGDAYRKSAIKDAIVKLQAVYWENGYSDVAIKAASRKRDETVSDIIITVTEGVSYKLGIPIVRANFKTTTNLVMRGHHLTIGGPFDYEPLAEVKHNLDELDIFDIVAIRTDDQADQQNNQKSVLIDVREKSTGYFDGGIDFNTIRGLELIGTVGNSNLFGRAIKLELSGMAGRIRSNASLGFSQPFLFSARVHNFFEVFYSDDRTHEGFSSARFGAETGVTKRLGRYWRVSLTYCFEREIQFDVDEDIAVDLATNPGRMASLTPSVTLDTRDDPFTPTKGLFLATSLKASTSTFGADLEFLRFEQDFRFFRSISEEWVLAGAIRTGRAWPLGSTAELPLAERFFLGGANTDRAFRENDMGPRSAKGAPLGGQTFLLSNLELRFPIWNIVYGGAFFDAGNIFSDTPTDPYLRPSAGFGLRLKTPIGPIRGDIGFNLDREGDESEVVFHFALGHAF